MAFGFGFGFEMNMHYALGGEGGAPAETFRLLTEDGAVLTTEAGDKIITEDAP